jgi:hypothetical protein
LQQIVTEPDLPAPRQVAAEQSKEVTMGAAPPRAPFVLSGTAWVLILAVLVVLLALVLLYV